MAVFKVAESPITIVLWKWGPEVGKMLDRSSTSTSTIMTAIWTRTVRPASQVVSWAATIRRLSSPALAVAVAAAVAVALVISPRMTMMGAWMIGRLWLMPWPQMRSRKTNLQNHPGSMNQLLNWFLLVRLRIRNLSVQELCLKLGGLMMLFALRVCRIWLSSLACLIPMGNATMVVFHGPVAVWFLLRLHVLYAMKIWT